MIALQGAGGIRATIDRACAERPLIRFHFERYKMVSVTRNDGEGRTYRVQQKTRLGTARANFKFEACNDKSTPMPPSWSRLGPVFLYLGVRVTFADDDTRKEFERQYAAFKQEHKNQALQGEKIRFWVTETMNGHSQTRTDRHEVRLASVAHSLCGAWFQWR